MDTERYMERSSDRNWKQMMWGVFLILLGVLFLADRLGALPLWAADYHWWGLLVIGLGLVSLARPRKAHDVGNGVTITLLGVWFVMASNNLYGLTWVNSWPLALVAAGAGSVARALAASFLPDPQRVRVRKERHHA